jgi:ubiquinone/menaquinone biosynthesis C-methylase UbiE
MLGQGRGRCLELGCGTGTRAAEVRTLGWTPLGVDLSGGMLRYARGRLPAIRADAARLPVCDGSMDAVITVMVHTDMPDYRAVLREVVRVLCDGGSFVHIGVHPAFCGGGYLDGQWTTASWTSQGVRDKVGATHLPLPEFLHAFLDAGLVLDRCTEGGGPVPVMFGVRARKR